MYTHSAPEAAAYQQADTIDVSKPVRVLYVDNSYTFGGAIACLEALVASLDRKSFEAIVVSAQPADVLRKLFPQSTYYSVDASVPWQHGKSYTRYLQTRLGGITPLRYVVAKIRALRWFVAHDIPMALRLAALGRKHKVQLVHLNNTYSSQSAGVFAALILGVPCIAHARGTQTGRWATRITAKFINRHIAISASIESNLLAIGVDPKRVTLVHDGIDTRRFALTKARPEVLAELGLRRDRPVVGWFGRIVDWKGLIPFLEAMARVVHQVPDVQVLIVGDASDGSQAYLRRAQSRALELGIASNVVFAGYRPDVPELMMLVDLIVHSSIVPEPFGLVVIEGMACGKAVVAANSGGPTEVIEDGVSGWLVDPTQTEHLAEAIVKAISDGNQTRAVGLRARRRVLEKFSAEANARSIAELYFAALG